VRVIRLLEQVEGKISKVYELYIFVAVTNKPEEVDTVSFAGYKTIAQVNFKCCIIQLLKISTLFLTAKYLFTDFEI
jgi:hypothetical protein